MARYAALAPTSSPDGQASPSCRGRSPSRASRTPGDKFAPRGALAARFSRVGPFLTGLRIARSKRMVGAMQSSGNVPGPLSAGQVGRGGGGDRRLNRRAAHNPAWLSRSRWSVQGARSGSRKRLRRKSPYVALGRDQRRRSARSADIKVSERRRVHWHGACQVPHSLGGQREPRKGSQVPSRFRIYPRGSERRSASALSRSASASTLIFSCHPRSPSSVYDHQSFCPFTQVNQLFTLSAK